MTTITTSTSPSRVIERAAALAGAISTRSAATEAARRVPSDLLHELVAAGCFRMLLPQTHGGSEASLMEALQLFETVARADASTGWVVMIGACGWCDLASLPRETFDDLFRPTADVIVAGVFAPGGAITPTDGGYRLEGRWSFASGCEHATLFFANAVEGFADGHPLMRGAVLDPADVVIEDTWHVAGLRGTGSHHFHVDGVVVPADRTFVPLVDPPHLDATIARVPAPAIFALGIASVAVGAARGALETVTKLAQEKVPLLAAAPLATNPLFQHDLARADAAVSAGWLSVVDAAGRLWARAEADEAPTLEERARARMAAAWATGAAHDATEFAYRSGGGGALYDDSPLQRRMRDLNAITQHFLVRPDAFSAAGSILAGQGLPVPVF